MAVGWRLEKPWRRGALRGGGNGGGERFNSVDWRALVADLVIELHWTRDQVLDQVDIAFLEDLHRAWADFPPLRRMAAACPRPQAASARIEELSRAHRPVSERHDQVK